MNNTSARKVAFDAYKRVLDDGAYSNLVLNHTLSKTSLSSEDKALTTKIVYGTLQWQGLLDYYLSLLSKRPLAKLSLKALYLLRIGAYQILFLDRIPDRACVDETVRVAKIVTHKGIVSLINGMLRNLSRKKIDMNLTALNSDHLKYLSVKYSHPQWMVDMWWKQYGYEDAIAIMEANNSEPEHTVRVNTLVTNRSKLQQDLAHLGVSSEPVEKVPAALFLKSGAQLVNTDLFNHGHFQLQDINSMVVSHLCSPNKNDRIIDLCSSPGGKTTHLAQMMDNTGKITAVDIHEHRIKLVRQVCDRLGITNVSFMTEDGTKLPWSHSTKDWHGEFDICLVDAPCSGLGTLRKRPELKWSISPADLDQLAALQSELLQAASYLTKPGGAIVYSTCTINKKENQYQIDKFLEANSAFEITPPEEILSSEMLADAIVSNSMLTYYPHYSKGDGFFMSKMVRH